MKIITKPVDLSVYIIMVHIDGIVVGGGRGVIMGKGRGRNWGKFVW